MDLPDKRRTKWPFDQTVADQICEKIAFGSRLTEISKKGGFPSYNVICRWRRDNPDFNRCIIEAYNDRLDDIRNRAFDALSRGDVQFARDYLKREMRRSVRDRYPSELKPKTDRRREIHIIDTGIRQLKVRNGKLLKVEEILDRDLKDLGISKKD